MRYLCISYLRIIALILATGCGGGSSSSPTPLPISVSLSPAMANVGANQSQQFTATVSGTPNTAVTWSAPMGAMSQTGLFTAPTSIPTPPQVTVTATSQADPTKSASATVTVVVGVQVVPQNINVQVNAIQNFFLNVFGATNPSFSWSVLGGNSNGTISPFGLALEQATYTAPATVPSPAQVTIKVTLQSDPTIFATSTLNVTPVIPSITVNPNPAGANVFSSQRFIAFTNNLS